MRSFAALLLTLSATAAFAANPVAEPSKLSPEWQAKSRAMFETAIAGAIAETGVNYISVGRITQSAPAVDIGLDYALKLAAE